MEDGAVVQSVFDEDGCLQDGRLLFAAGHAREVGDGSKGLGSGYLREDWSALGVDVETVH